jgi:hypothetical protein
MRTLVAVLVTFLLTAAVAPAQQKGSPAAAKKSDSCLLSKAEIQQIVGKEISDPQVIKTTATLCQVTVGGAGILNFIAVQPRPGETPDRFFQEMQKRKYAITEVKGIGDRSFFVVQPVGMIQLSTYKGPNNVLLTIFVPGVPEAKQKDMAGKLMEKLLTRL